VASEAEVEYLLKAAGAVFPQLQLSRDDVSLHYSGVRPLPYVDASTPAAITRRHFLKEHEGAEVSLYSVIGGKLTTCRSLAEQAAQTLLPRLGIRASTTSRDRPLPGGELSGKHAEAETKKRVALDLDYSPEQIDAVWRLCGGVIKTALASDDSSRPDDRENLPGTNLPLRFVRYCLAHEWPRRLSDLVERRLLLHFHEQLGEPCLRRLAELMIEAKLLTPEQLDSEIAACRRRLTEHYGKTLR
jgi:glycerol-3-phosphate dehydrogenase